MGEITERRMMKAAVVDKFKQQLEIKEVPVPSLEYGEVLVKIKACGVCHTDLHAAHGDWPVKPKLPLIPGHEGVGRGNRRRGNFNKGRGSGRYSVALFCMWRV